MVLHRWYIHGNDYWVNFMDATLIICVKRRSFCCAVQRSGYGKRRSPPNIKLSSVLSSSICRIYEDPQTSLIVTPNASYTFQNRHANNRSCVSSQCIDYAYDVVNGWCPAESKWNGDQRNPAGPWGSGMTLLLNLWRPLLPYGYSYEASCTRPG